MNCGLDWSMQWHAHNMDRGLIASVALVLSTMKGKELHTAGEV